MYNRLIEMDGGPAVEYKVQIQCSSNRIIMLGFRECTDHEADVALCIVDFLEEYSTYACIEGARGDEEGLVKDLFVSLKMEEIEILLDRPAHTR